MRNFTSGKSDIYVLAAAASCGFKIVLRPTAAARHGFNMVLFTEPMSHQNTFVGGTCAPPSALLVVFTFRMSVSVYSPADWFQSQQFSELSTFLVVPVALNSLILIYADTPLSIYSLAALFFLIF